jgi:hypothetical protein
MHNNYRNFIKIFNFILSQIGDRFQSVKLFFQQWVRFQVLTAESMKVTVSWDVALCSLVEIDRRFRGAYCLHY